MPRSSESVAALATALAKAQAELVNPEKSLIATIKGERAGQQDRTFRYAPLSSGLEIVRKTLSQHQIAAIQTTAIDQAGGLVNLTTTLAHSSGEWIASDWPVCPIADMGSPRRMGAALTYARRYALFTLVGIAGEDDLDAPDLNVVDAGAPNGSAHGAGRERVASMPNSSPLNSRARPNGKVSSPTLDVEQSAALRDRLLGQLAGLAHADAATGWAKTALLDKNRLGAADAKLVEDAFEHRLAALFIPEVAEPKPADAKAASDAREVDSTDQGVALTHSGHSEAAGKAQRIDKSALAVSEPRRYRNKAHLRFVATKPCLICGRRPSDPHHLRFTQPRALGRKVSDEYAVPLCRTHHRANHHAGDERAWWRQLGMDPVKIARDLWRETRGARFAIPPTVSAAPETVVEQADTALGRPSRHFDEAAGRTP
jgi:ERF superfamily protein